MTRALPSEPLSLVAGAPESSLELSALDRLDAGIFGVDSELRVVHWNAFMATHSGRTADEVLGKPLFAVFPDLPHEWLSWKIKTVFVLGAYAFSSWRQRPYVFRFPHNRPLTGGIDCMRQDVTFLPIRKDGAVTAVCGVVSDVTDVALAQLALERAHAALQAEVVERQRVETELRLAQRLEAIGRLAAGLAHEINTPVQFVGDTVAFLQDAYRDVRGLLELHREALAELGAAVSPAMTARLAQATEAAELAYLDANVAGGFTRCEDGLGRVAAVVRAMKEFGAPDHRARSSVDLNRAIRTTLATVAAELAPVGSVVTDFADVPSVPGFGNQLNLALLHLIVNAASAIVDAGRGAKGELRIVTRRDHDRVVVQIRDNGVGIPAELRERIFDMYFTTRDVGRGSGGQGLAMVASIVAHHGGTVTVDSEVGIGSTFEVRLPIR
ncbi:MAG TPA: ATP-binding protein [Kofleriaceae bacterium]|nr:ATP-binding protein [Kofleriaceae bacterium]